MSFPCDTTNAAALTESIATTSTAVPRIHTDLVWPVQCSLQTQCIGGTAGDATNAESLDPRKREVHAVKFSGPLKKLVSGCLRQEGELRWCEIKDGCLQWWDHPQKKSENPKKCLRLVDMKLEEADGSNSIFTFSTASGKAKKYMFDADVMGAISQYGKHADCWNATRDDWIKNLTQEENAAKQRRSTVGGA